MKTKKAKTSKESGFSTIELMIAMVILVLMLTAIIFVVFGNQTVALDNQVNAEALQRANSLIEQANAQSRVDFNSLGYSSDSEDIYDEEILITDINPCKKSGIASVSWMTGADRPLQVHLNTTFVNIPEAIALGGDCGSDEAPETEWFHPDTFVDIDLKDLGGPNNGTSATSIDLMSKGGNTYAVLTTKHATTTTNDLWIIDVTDIADGVSPFTASLEGSFDTGAGGLNDADVVSENIFAANFENTKQVLAFNITDLSAPDLIASKSLPGVNPAGSFPEGRRVFYYDNRVYVGINETAGPEFHIYDVSTPGAPSHIDSLELTHNVRDIIVRGNYAYLATSDNTGEVMIIDIDPLSSDYMVHPDITGMKYNVPGDFDGVAIDLVGYKLYLSRAGGKTTPYEPNLIILDVSDPEAITVLGSKLIPKNPSGAGLGMTAISVAGRFAFLGTDDSDFEFQIYNIENPALIRNCSETGYPGGFSGCGKYNFPAKVTDIEYYNNLVYSSIESNNAFRVFFDNPALY